jgi:two-component system chemotaxis response regulator CheB
VAAPVPVAHTEPRIRVMLVDDSAVVRGFIVRMLESDPRIEIAATCSNGQMAVQQAGRRELDVILLDVEMPVMNGLEALPLLLKANPTAKVIVASTLTQRNAAISLEALALGATDYIPKPTHDKLGGGEEFRRHLLEKIVGLAAKKSARAPLPVKGSRTGLRETVRAAAPPIALRKALPVRPKLIAIGSSTGGPQALLALLAALPKYVDCPIVIAQHMPATFTTVLAQHLGRASGRPSAEAVNGGEIRPGTITLAPGDFHLEILRDGHHCTAKLTQSPPENFCRPSVDPLFRSVARAFGADVCGVVLTGMGSDGCAGARSLAAAGAPLVAQDEASSVVWGMPGAVANAGLCTAVLPLKEISGHLEHMFERAGR